MDKQLPQVNFGAHISVPDYRDVKDYYVSDAEGVPYPPSFTDDLSGIPVTMQNTLGICTANLCYIIERLYQKNGINVRLSRRFLYTVTKHYIDQNVTEGSSLRSALKAAYKYGVATEDSVPTDTMVSHETFIADFTFTPEIWAEALKYRIGGYIAVGTDKDSISSAISQYGAIYARFSIGSEWWLPSWAAKDILPLRTPANPVSGHAVIPYSYDSTFPKNHSILRNSWSTAWGNQGNGDFYIDDYAPTEAWAVTLTAIVNTLPPAVQFSYNFKKDMSLGDTNDDVKELQTFLKIHGYFDFPSATGFYGSVTQDAVYQFQLAHIQMNLIEKYIYKGEYCGAKTRAAINAMI